jgi:ADP-glucose pyrophosphorylase
MLTQPGPPFSFYDAQRPIFTHQRFLPPSRFRSCTVEDSIIAEGCFADQCHVRDSVIGIRTRVGRGTRITRSVLLGADFYPWGKKDPRTKHQGPRTGQEAMIIGRCFRSS